ncbi:MAG: T9SS type A sorting domain-containing protein [candidate division WOR-3 bacterium]|nr:MAG: T9SS type A sorting domain-containing protein [candidate division WOR-3 bacterium]
MKPVSFVLALVLCATMAARASDTSPVYDGRTPRPFHRAPVPSHDSVPGFGTVLDSWRLNMSGSYAGSGMTWRQDEARFYLMGQGLVEAMRVWKLDPADPPGSIERVPWQSQSVVGESDAPWSIAWDKDSGCFWISAIIDGNVYGGCYLFRFVWDGDSWVWRGTEGDSWYVGNGSNGGGLLCLWVAGMEKTPLDSPFYAAPVHSSPSPMNHVVRFDPYTKTNLGRVANGDSISERGCALIPWDSSYILTCGWRRGTFCKRDSTGLLLDSVQAPPGGQADWALYVPRFINPDDTVCVYCIHSHASNCFQRVSAGMLWNQLPSAFPHSARPHNILAPVGTVDSGTTVMPRMVVRNFAEVTAENVSVHLLIDNEADRAIYHDSLLVTLAPRSADTLEFVPWTVTGRDSMGATGWTSWAGDSATWDDTVVQRFFVRVTDVGISAVETPIPGDTIDPDTIYPSCVVWNHGNITVTFPMVFNIGLYSDTVLVSNLIAGGSRPATAAQPWVASRGVWRCLMKAEVDRDLHPENNDTTFIFFVRGASEYDIMVAEILAPSGVMDTTPFTPYATVRNLGSNPDPDSFFMAWFWIGDSVGIEVYRDSVPEMPPQGNLSFRACTLRLPGNYVASCSVYLAGDWNRANDALHLRFSVAPGAGAGEKPRVRAEEEMPEPTVVRGILTIPLAADRQELVALHDPMGRLVMVLKPGDNDVSRLGPGVYYVRTMAGGSLVSRKLVKLQ